MSNINPISAANIQELANGNELVFKQVFDAYWDKIYRVSLKLTKNQFYAEEMTQELFVKLWQKRSLLVDVTDIEAYLNRMARNLFIDKLRSKVFTVNHEEFLLNYYISEQDCPIVKTEYKYLTQSVNEAIASLPENLRLVYTLNREGGLSHKSIAKRLGITVLTSKNYMVRALKAIRSYLHINEEVTFIFFCLGINFF